MTSADNIRLGLAARFVQLIRATLAATYRVRVDGDERLCAQIESGTPGLIAFWHELMFALSPVIIRRVIRRGAPLVVLASLSRDGELAAKIAALSGVHVVRGSSSRGGFEGLRAIHRSVQRHGWFPVVAPDGPRGPARRAKPGAIVLAQLGGLPIVPIGCTVDRSWRLKSWDRMVVPKPFARVHVRIGEALHVPGDLGHGALDAEQRRLEAALDACSGRPAGADIDPGV